MLTDVFSHLNTGHRDLDQEQASVLPGGARAPPRRHAGVNASRNFFVAWDGFGACGCRRFGRGRRVCIWDEALGRWCIWAAAWRGVGVGVYLGQGPEGMHTVVAYCRQDSDGYMFRTLLTISKTKCSKLNIVADPLAEYNFGDSDAIFIIFSPMSTLYLKPASQRQGASERLISTRFYQAIHTNCF
jgi:hypothetical protein